MPTKLSSNILHLLSEEKVFFGSHMFYWSENEHTMTQQKVGLLLFSFSRALAYCEIKKTNDPTVSAWFSIPFLQFDFGLRENIRFEYYTKNSFGTRWLGNNHNCKVKWMSCKAKTWRFQNGADAKTKATLISSYKRCLTMVIFCPEKLFLHVHLSFLFSKLKRNF